MWEIINIISFEIDPGISERYQYTSPVGAGMWNLPFSIPIICLLWYHAQNLQHSYQVAIMILVWLFTYIVYMI